MLNSLSNVLTTFLRNLWTSVLRFKTTYLLSVICMILSVGVVSDSFAYSFPMVETLFESWIFSLHLFLPISATLHLLAEHKGSWFRFLPYLVLPLAWVYQTYVDSQFLGGVMDGEILAIITHILVAYAIFMILPHLLSGQEGLPRYVLKLIMNFIQVVFFSVVLVLLIFATIFTLSVLFGIQVEYYVHISTVFVVMHIFAIPFFLASVPPKDGLSQKTGNGLSILFLYILVPFLTIYSVIIHIYFVGQFMTMSFPDGVVADMLLWYITLSIITIYFVKSLIDEDLPSVQRIIKGYIDIYKYTLILPMIILLIASYIRIDAYGFTENRVYLTAVNIICLLSLLTLFFQKKRWQILIPCTGIFFALLISVGPTSASNITKLSQEQRLYHSSLEAGLIDSSGKFMEKAQYNESLLQNIVETYSFLRYRFDKPAFVKADDKLMKFLDTQLEAYNSELRGERRYLHYPDGDLTNRNLVSVTENIYIINKVITGFTGSYTLDNNDTVTFLDDQILINRGETTLLTIDLNEVKANFVSKTFDELDRVITNQDNKISYQTPELSVDLVLEFFSGDKNNLDHAYYEILVIILYK